MIGQKLSPILIEIENALWESECFNTGPLEYTTEGFRAAIKIFMSAMLDKMWDYQQKQGLTLDECSSQATELGEELKEIIKRYTNIDTFDLYEKVDHLHQQT